MAPGLAADRGLRRRPGRPDQTGRHLHGARLHQPAGLPEPRRRANRAPHLQGVARAARRRGPGLEGLRPQRDRLLALLLAGALPDPPHPGDPALQPRRLPLRPLGPQLQHRLLLRHQHQLAVLRRRNDAHLLRPDGRADGAELRLGRGRDRRRRRPDPRHRRPVGTGARQLLAGPGPHPALHPGADLDRRRPLPRLPGRDPEPQRLDGDPHPHRRQPDPRPGPGRLAGGDQGARHQRRRLLQRQLRLPVRERQRPDQLLRDAADPGHPGQPHLHLRPHGRQPAPGLGDLLGDVRPLHRRRRRRLHGRAARHRRPARGRPPHPRLPRLHRRQHGGQGAALRGRRHLALDGDHHRHLLRRGQRRLRVADRARPGGALRQPQLQRGRLRRRRHRPLLDAPLRPAGGLHRRPDGRPHPRVPRQEDPGARDQAGLARGPGDAAGGAALLRPRLGDRARQTLDLRRASTRRASRRPSTPTSRRPTTTAPPWPATPASSSPTRPATSAPTGSASPTCSAAW